MDLKLKEKKYLSEQLIAYIGNKRSLLSLIRNSIIFTGETEGIFLDLFSGSGSVSRLAKTMGFSVYSNDWEFYSYVINQAYLTIHEGELDELFKDEGGFQAVLDDLNSLKDPNHPYISRYYSPADGVPDPKKERLFYTRENGLKIDSVREKIEAMYPEWNKKKYLLTALLLYQSATHTNTSGVFKAFHNGFGGLGKDALKRILKPIQLSYPVLYPKIAPEYFVFQKDVNQLAGEIDWDKIKITYLDPPYNQHQYGSNYHLLNTIALWDKPKISNDFKADGKAGIRKDWQKTKSDYCYAKTAVCQFADLIQKIKSPYILISYNTEGIIPFHEMINILKEHGKVTFYTDRYTKYKGGRQSLERKINNLEFVIILEKEKVHSKEDTETIYKILTEKKIEVLKGCLFDEKVMAKEGWQNTIFGYQRDKNTLFLENLLFSGYEGDERVILDILEKAHILSRKDEIKILFDASPKKYEKKILNSFKKIVHKKYFSEFKEIYDLVFEEYQHRKEFQVIQNIARKRGVLEI
ncbi:MAG TPA: DNA methyltransferase [Spirochaetia bacterium]|nr:DNA methyltransferase [Spirochaetia bacterium]